MSFLYAGSPGGHCFSNVESNSFFFSSILCNNLCRCWTCFSSKALHSSGDLLHCVLEEAPSSFPSSLGLSPSPFKDKTPCDTIKEKILLVEPNPLSCRELPVELDLPFCRELPVELDLPFCNGDSSSMPSTEGILELSHC